MRITSVLVGLVCLAAALSFTVWVGGNAQKPADNIYHSSPSADLPDAAKAAADGAKAYDFGQGKAEGDKAEEPSPEISKTGPYPKVHVEQANYTFAAMEPETFGEHLFTIRNDGEAPLILRRGKSTCACTGFEILKNDVPPGGSAQILVKWRPKEREHRFQQSLDVKTNDPTKPVVKLTIDGLVEPKLIMLPGNPWTIGTYAGKEDSNPKYGTITSRMVDNLQIDSVEVEHPERMTVTITPLAADDDLIEKEGFLSGVKIEAILHPEIPIGDFDEKVTLRTNVPQYEVLDFSVKGHRTGPIRVYPTQGVRFYPDRMLLSMGKFPSQDGKKVELRILVSDMEGEFEISDIESDPKFLKMTVEKDKTTFADPTRQRFLLTFEVPPDGPSHARTFENLAEIKFRTNHPQVKEMTFYVDYVAL